MPGTLSRKSAYIVNFLFSTVKYAAVVFLIIIAASIISLAFSFSDLKNSATSILSAKSNLEIAVSGLKSGSIDGAASSSALAQEDFLLAISYLEKAKNNPAPRFIPLIRRQLEDLEYLARTGEIVSRSLIRAIPIVSSFRAALGANDNFSSLDPTEKAAFLKLLYESEPELNGLKANLELALLDIGRIRKVGVMFFVKDKIVSLKEELQSGLDIIGRIPAASKILPALAGYPESGRFLLIMQNNDELRPSGGFIGVFGLLETKNGEIVSLSTHDSYHLDMPASLADTWNTQAPAPLAKYLEVEKWYLRDANWSPDWPTSARDILRIYDGEKKAVGEEPGSFSGVIALNPNFIADLIELSGPITVRGETYNKDNFQELLQYNVEMAYKDQDISSWDRKEVIGEIVSVLKERLFSLPKDRFPDFINIISRHTSNRDIQIYFQNSRLNELASGLGLSGEVKDSGGDYIFVVDANLGAYKSDSVVKKSFSYSIDEKKDKFYSSLHLNYSHSGGFDWRTTRYRSYTRVYVPQGASFISLRASGRANLEEDSVISYEDKELKKTVFAFFFSVEPGTEGGIDIDYSLPSDLSKSLNDDGYRLLVQKQSGQRVEPFSFTMKKNGKLKREGSYEFQNDILVY